MISMWVYTDSKFTNVNYPRKENALHEVKPTMQGRKKVLANPLLTVQGSYLYVALYPSTSAKLRQTIETCKRTRGKFT